MQSVFYSIVLILLLLCGILVLMREKSHSTVNPIPQASPKLNLSDIDEREDYFAKLISKITPDYYWRVSHEYVDFAYTTIKHMSIDELSANRELFNAQRRCSDLNSAIYRYYDNLRKRCAEGEKVPFADIEVLNLRQCFNEFSHHAYPELVALVWPHYQCPEVDLANV
ncbi:MAG TPA: RNA helicase [Buttiauxella sp.]|uniref:ESA_00282 family adhesion-associated protein n=1 Tax=Buttiauxella sp. TaxID=1972222 RepID=UPI002B47491C|nr:RNA helicase [Buttiauxella sp.]HKM95198.1 RNA helicase [Buttiauxella sp.]